MLDCPKAHTLMQHQTVRLSQGSGINAASEVILNVGDSTRPYQVGRTHPPKVTKRLRQQTKEEEEEVILKLPTTVWILHLPEESFQETDSGDIVVWLHETRAIVPSKLVLLQALASLQWKRHFLCSRAAMHITVKPGATDTTSCWFCDLVLDTLPAIKII